MIYVGANNNTASQIADVIGKDKSRQEIIQYYSQVIKNYSTKDSDPVKPDDTKTRKRLHSSDKNEESVNIIIANKLFVSNDTSFLPEFEEILKNEYGAAEPEKLNFGDNEASAKEINNFVCEATKGVIKRIITPEDVNSDMVAAIINAVYFQGFWEKPFQNRRKRKFHSNPVRKIDMMTTSPKDGDWNYRAGKEWTALGIPYKSRKTWMFIVLPEKKNGLSDLLEKMDAELFKDVTTW
uniref:Serpin domain-containing protein n=1 Tax=Panagrolaimus davidi TaxID=227884 RepID=A0A914PTS9_9BILA